MSDDDRVQLYRLRGKWVLRAPPSGPASPAQERARSAFAEAASRAAGTTRTGALPPAAIKVAESMTNKTFGGPASPRGWELLLVDYLVSRGIGYEEARKIVMSLGNVE